MLYVRSQAGAWERVWGAGVFQYRFGVGRSFFPTSFPSRSFNIVPKLPLGDVQRYAWFEIFYEKHKMCYVRSQAGAWEQVRGAGVFQYRFGVGRSFFPTSFPSSRLGTYRDTHGLRFFIKNIRCVVCPLPSRSLGASLGGRSFSISVWEGRSFFPTSFPSSRLGTFRDTHSLRFFMKNIRCVVCPLPSRSLGASLGGRSFSISVWGGQKLFSNFVPKLPLGNVQKYAWFEIFYKKHKMCCMSAPKQELGSEFGGQEFFNIGLGGQKLFSNFVPKLPLGNV